MSRTVKYIFAILIIGALALWLLTMYRSCERQKLVDDPTVTNTTGTDDDAFEDEDNGNDDLYVDDEETDPNSSNTDSDTDGTTSTNDPEDDDTDEDSNSGANNESGGVFADGEADIDGEYLVVAGAFVLKENAEKYIRNLKSKGIDAERRVFLGSDYHSVIIGNFESEGAARTVAKQLDAGAYVHKKRYLKKR